MGRRDVLSQDTTREGHREWRDAHTFLRQEAGSSRAWFKSARSKGAHLPTPPLRTDTPHIPKVRPSTLTEGKMTSCLHLAMASQARHQGTGPSQGPHSNSSEKRGSLRLPTGMRPEAEMGVQPGRQAPPFDSAWEAAGTTGNRQGSWEGLGRGRAVTSRVGCPWCPAGCEGEGSMDMQQVVGACYPGKWVPVTKHPAEVSAVPTQTQGRLEGVTCCPRIPRPWVAKSFHPRSCERYPPPHAHCLQICPPK